MRKSDFGKPLGVYDSNGVEYKIGDIVIPTGKGTQYSITNKKRGYIGMCTSYYKGSIIVVDTLRSYNITNGISRLFEHSAMSERFDVDTYFFEIVNDFDIENQRDLYNLRCDFVNSKSFIQEQMMDEMRIAYDSFIYQVFKEPEGVDDIAYLLQNNIDGFYQLKDNIIKLKDINFNSFNNLL